MNLVGTALSPESINLTWSGAMKFWQPQEFMVVYCHVRHLSVASLPIRGNFCRYDTVKDQSLIIEGLEPFSEYNISIIGKLPPFEKTASALGSARTRKIECFFLKSQPPMDFRFYVLSFLLHSSNVRHRVDHHAKRSSHSVLVEKDSQV